MVIGVLPLQTSNTKPNIFTSTDVVLLKDLYQQHLYQCSLLAAKNEKRSHSEPTGIDGSDSKQTSNHHYFRCNRARYQKAAEYDHEVDVEQTSFVEYHK
ncbi:hypothetical protein Q1695_012241 [Nippostrongylus brasiliensis]|nr:hypothetical protein Q1695_012241 [Nippostrongylus brasiliensis]